MMKKIACALLLSAATPAFAVVSPFGGPATGVDPLGHAWTASGTHWGEPGYLAGTLTFNPGSLTGFGTETYATSFSFTFNAGVAGSIDQTPSTTPFGSDAFTRFSNLADGVAWLVTFNGPNQVIFTAPTQAAALNVGDSFFVNIAFTGAIDPKRFSFSALWDEEPVNAIPEPATWAMMIAGFGIAGASLRRRSTKVSFA